MDKALRETVKEDGSSVRRDASLVLQSAGIRNVHDVMVALGFGAQALCPYAMIEKAMDGSPEPITAAANVLEGLQKGMEKVLSTLGIHELRGYGAWCRPSGWPEVLDILAIPGFCASEGRGLGLAALDRLAEQGREIRAGEESPSKVKLPRMYPKVWKALARVANSERGYEEFAETLDALETEQPVALRHAVASAARPRRPARPGRPGQLQAWASTPLPFHISSMSFGSPGRDRVPRLRGGRHAGRHALHERRGRRDPGHVSASTRKQPRPADRLAAASASPRCSLNSSDYLEIKIGQGAKPGEGGHLPGRRSRRRSRWRATRSRAST